MTKIIIAFCEGQDDIAFLSKVLLVGGFNSYNNKIKDFIKPLKRQFQTKLPNKKIGDKKLGFQSEYITPSLALSKGKEAETLVLFHNLGGDANVKGREKILSMYQDLQNNSGDDEFTNFGLEFRFLYFFDADNKGISARVGDLNTELKLNNPVEHSKIKPIGSYEWGCYIFHDNKTKQGELEDILLELMKNNNATIFTNSENFIASNLLPINRQIQFKENKSIISIAGQLQVSGANNSVIISKSDYIQNSDIKSNTHCKDILSLFQ